MDIKVNNRVGRHVDDVLTPEDNLIFRCPSCQLFYLPKEACGGVTRWRRADGGVGVALAMGCADKDCMYQGEPIILTREQYEQTRKYERAGLIPAEHGITGILAN